MDYSPILFRKSMTESRSGNWMAGTCEKGAGILIPRAAIGNQEIIEALSVRKDLRVDDVATYDTAYTQQLVVDETGKFMRQEIDCAVFTSASDGSRICGGDTGTGLYESDGRLYRKTDESGGRRLRYEDIHGGKSHH